MDAFEDITAVQGMENFKIQADGNAVLTLDHYMIYKARRGEEQKLRNSVEEEQLQYSYQLGVRINSILDIKFH